MDSPEREVFNGQPRLGSPERPKSPKRERGSDSSVHTRGTGASYTPRSLTPNASTSSIESEDNLILGRRSSQNNGLLTFAFDKPGGGSRVVTEASEDRVDTMGYTNMMKDIWQKVDF